MDAFCQLGYPCCNNFSYHDNGCGANPRDDKIYVNRDNRLRKFVDGKYLGMFTAVVNAKYSAMTNVNVQHQRLRCTVQVD